MVQQIKETESANGKNPYTQIEIQENPRKESLIFFFFNFFWLNNWEKGKSEIGEIAQKLDFFYFLKKKKWEK